jgi:hypothetical protein
MKLVRGFLLETTEENEGIILTKQGVFQRVRLDTYSMIGEEVYGLVINVGNKIKGSLLIGLFFVLFILTQAFFYPKVTVGADSYPSQPSSKVMKNKIKEESLFINDPKVLFLDNNEKSKSKTLLLPKLEF